MNIYKMSVSINKTFLGSLSIKSLNLKTKGSINLISKKGVVIIRVNNDEYKFKIPKKGTWVSPWLYGQNTLIIEVVLNGKKHNVEIKFNKNDEKKMVFEFFRNKLPKTGGTVKKMKYTHNNKNRTIKN